MNNNGKKYSYLLKNSLIFGVGTFGSKVLQLLIVPLYTYVLSTVEYGQIDIFSTTISLVLPFITLLIHESIIRFLTVDEISKEQAVNSGMLVFFNSIIIAILITPVYAFVFDKKYAALFLVCLVFNAFVAIFQNYLKACGQIVDFTVCGLINTFSFLITNLLMLLVFNLGANGYIYSMIISQIASSIYIIIKGHIFRNISLSRRDFPVLQEMLRYSVPLIPNNLMWWIMNAGDKYIINYFLGDSANGLYSISIKIATIISTLFSIFMQAWQLSAIEESGNDERTKFYSKVYSCVMALLFGTTSIILIINKPLFSIIIGEQFFEAHQYSPLLCVATVINCMSTFFGVTYLVNKSTQKAFTTTVIGAITNVLANFLLIKPLGLTGVALGTILGYVVVTIIRIRDTKITVSMNFDTYRTLFGITIIFLASVGYMFVNGYQSVFLGCLCLFLFTILYRFEIKELYFVIQRSITNRE